MFKINYDEYDTALALALFPQPYTLPLWPKRANIKVNMIRPRWLSVTVLRARYSGMWVAVINPVSYVIFSFNSQYLSYDRPHQVRVASNAYDYFNNVVKLFQKHTSKTLIKKIKTSNA